MQVYTLRQGEMVRDLDGTPMVLERELIKIKGRENAWTCIFFDQKTKACAIYKNRPVECRALKCWDPTELHETIKKPRLQRRDLLNANDGILKIIDAHEKRCSYGFLESAVGDLMGPGSQHAAGIILDAVRYDGFVRTFVAEKFRLDPDMTDFFFGRPLSTTIAMFGLAVKEQGDTVFLAPIKTTQKG